MEGLSAMQIPCSSPDFSVPLKWGLPPHVIQEPRFPNRTNTPLTSPGPPRPTPAKLLRESVSGGGFFCQNAEQKTTNLLFCLQQKMPGFRPPSQYCSHCCSGTATDKTYRAQHGWRRGPGSPPQPLESPQFPILRGKSPRTSREFSHATTKFPTRGDPQKLALTVAVSIAPSHRHPTWKSRRRTAFSFVFSGNNDPQNSNIKSPLPWVWGDVENKVRGGGTCKAVPHVQSVLRKAPRRSFNQNSNRVFLKKQGC